MDSSSHSPLPGFFWIFIQTFIVCILFIVACIVIPDRVWAELSLYSIFPNTENDAELEYIALQNNSCRIQSFSGYSLSDASGRVFAVPDFSLDSLAIRKWYRPETKITLNNESETIFLTHLGNSIANQFSYATSIKGQIIPIHEATSCMPDPVVTDAAGPTDGTSSIPETPIISTGSFVSSGTWTGSADPVNGISTWSVVLDATQANDMGSGSMVIPIADNTGTLLVDSTWSSISSGVVVSSTGNAISSSGSSGVVGSSSGDSPIARIHVQSGLDDALSCFRDDCAVNVEFTAVSTKTRCAWEFPGWSYAAEDVLKCNPSYVHYPKGEFPISLKVCSAINPLDCSTSQIIIRNYGYSSAAAVTSALSPSSTSTSSISEIETVTATPAPANIIATTGSASSEKTLVYPSRPSLFMVTSDDGLLSSGGVLRIACVKTPCFTDIAAEVIPSDSFKGYRTFWYFPNGMRSGAELKKFAIPSRRTRFRVRKVDPKTGYFFEIQYEIERMLVPSESWEKSENSVSVAAETDSPDAAPTIKTKKTAVKTQKTSIKSGSGKSISTGSGRVVAAKEATQKSVSTKAASSALKSSSLESGMGSDATPWLPISIVLSILAAFSGGAYFVHRFAERDRDELEN